MRKPPLFRYDPAYYSDGRGVLLTRVRFGDDFIERPVRELVAEAVFAPVIVYTLWNAMKRGWGH